MRTRFWWTLLVVFLLLVAGLVCIDEPLTTWCAHLPARIHSLAHGFSWVIAPEVYFVGLPILYLLTFYFLGKKKASPLLFLIVGLSCSLLVTDLLKGLFGRARPELWLTEQIYGFFWLQFRELYWSFPSGHATTIGALAGTIAHFQPRWVILWMVIAIVSSSCRILGLDHFFSDVLAGVFVGFLISRKSSQWLERRSIRSSKRSGS